MIKQNQTLHDFNAQISEIKRVYLDAQFAFNQKFTSFLDIEGETKYCMVANQTQATKIIFDESNQCIVTQTIYKSDLDIFNKLRSEL